MEKYTDNIIEENVINCIREQFQETALDIKVNVKDGNVILSGIVDVLSEKNDAEKLAKRIDGVKSIQNCITVCTDGSFSDKETEEQVINKIRKYDNLSSVGVNVVRGIAILEGDVNTLKDRNLAINTACEAMGVKDIVSHIEISSLYSLDDATLQNRIEDGLLANNLDRCHIDVRVDNGSVYLNGFTNYANDIEAAQEIIADIEGVRHIRNFLKVRHSNM